MTDKKRSYDDWGLKIIKKMEEGIIPWKRTWVNRWTPFRSVKGVGKRNAITDIPYTGGNEMLLNMYSEDDLFLTFNQIKKCGGNIKRSQGKNWIPILFWSSIDKVKEVKDKNGDTTMKSVTIRFLRYYLVWGLSQTENVKLPKHKPISEISKKIIDAIPDCENILDGYKNRPSIFLGSPAYYPRLDKISMPDKKDFVGIKEYYSTLFHELIHSTGHKDRIGRSGVTNYDTFGSDQYSKEELIAEIGASYLCSYADINNHKLENNSTAYLQSWISCIKNDPKILFQAAAKAEQACEFIINGGKIDTENEITKDMQK